ncbi:MAG: ATP-binding cassette domain-containing protein [Myxococcales bacterium]|nr:ATP-binding cassette domain-containing protein [Myxococcales bacterium]
MSDLMIEAQELHKLYGSQTALQKASFKVHRGEVVGLLGPNGAGKSTTMKILTCYISPTSGTATVNGCDVFDDPVGARRAIGYLPESTPLYYEMMVLEYLEFMAAMRGFKGVEGRRRIKTAVEQTSLGDVLGKEIRALSKGYKQRVGLAQALVHEPPILILDEPMSGLDPNQASEIRDLIKEIGEKRTVILSTHNLAEVQVTCDRVLIISGGRIVADDTPEELTDRAGKAKYVATVKGDASSSAATQKVFEKIKGAATVRARTGEEAGELIFEVLPEGDKDLRADIFKAAVAADLVLLGLEHQGENLEDIFRELTRVGEA